MISSGRLLVVSAKDPHALEARIASLAPVTSDERLELADVAFTLAKGRQAFVHRAALVLPPKGSSSVTAEAMHIERATAHVDAEVAFMFPGQGSQFIGMGRELYVSVPEYKALFDECDAVLTPLLGASLGSVLFDDDPDGSRAEFLKQTSIAQPALFVTEYALARVLQNCGVNAGILIGHSIGEYAAACLAGVFSLRDALELVVKRGQLMQSMPRGSMLAVHSRPEDVASLLAAHGEVATMVSLAAHNAPQACVVSGPSAAVDAFAHYLDANGVGHQALHTSHAFHSSMMDPILDEFELEVSKVERKPPTIPIVSGLTGEVLSTEQACSPNYWADQLRHTVQFARGVQTICSQPGRILLEVGPGTALVTSAAKQETVCPPLRLLETLGHPKLARPAFEALLRCLGRLWTLGVALDFDRIYEAHARRFVRLPTYPFTRSRHWQSVPTVLTANVTALDAASELEIFDEAPEVPSNESANPSLTPLKALLEERLGRPLVEHEWTRSLIEIGFDSLALTQLSGKLLQNFGARVPFRRFFEDLDSPLRLSEYLIDEGALPRASQSAPQVTARPTPGIAPPERTTRTERPQQRAVPSAKRTDIEALSERLERIENLLNSLLGQRPEPSPSQPTSPSPPLRFEPTTAQREIWVAANVGGPNANLAYNECRAISFAGTLDVGALRRALATLIERHEALRQTFSADGSWCTTGEAASESYELAIVDLRSYEQDAKQTALRELERRQVTTPFDLAAGPLVRVELVRTSDNDSTLLVCAHHIVSDGYSFGILTRELAELYSAQVERRQPELPRAESFAAYAERIHARDAQDKASIDHWLAHLSGYSTDLTLPIDAPRPATRCYDSSRLDFALTEALASKLRAQAANARVSTQTLLMSAFQLLLHALTRQTDIVLGVPTAGQVNAGMEALVGHCVHVLPFRVQLELGSTFGAHAQRLNRTVLDGLEHQGTTFSELLEHLGRPRDQSRIPLIPVAFGMGRSLKYPKFSGLETNLRVVPRTSESFELYVYVTEDAGGLEVSWSYSSVLFEAATVAHWHRCFNAILNRIADAGLEQRLSDIDVLAPEDRQSILQLAQGPQCALTPHEPVAQRIATVAHAFPERVAVIDATGLHSYRAIDERANQMAHVLRRLVKPEASLVAVCLDRSVELVSSLIGVWRAGLGYIPLDPAYPATRIEMILEDAGAPLVLTSRALEDRTPAGVERVFIEDLVPELHALPTTTPPESTPAPEDTAYVIFTSGSTGRPKGVVIQQGAFENFIQSMQLEPGFTPSDRLLAITTVSFDIAGLELFLPLSVGGSLLLATREQASDPRALERLMQQHDITFMQATPATWQMLFDSGWQGKPGLKALCGGEALPQHLAERFLLAQAELWNVYGPTETTVWSTAKHITSSDRLTIGKPIANTTLYVLDEHKALLPVGATGELWIGGKGVAWGYLGRPDLTQERFVTSPFTPNERLYKTGDLARLRHDGEFECQGRSDFQVKIRGFRIELGEIESAILKNPTVTACVVVARQVDPGEKSLVAYVVTRGDARLDIETLRRELGNQLPSYMLPSALCVLNALPMTPNNKVDRNALPEPSKSEGYESPELVRQAASRHLWRQTWAAAPLVEHELAPQHFLVLSDDSGIGDDVVARLEQQGHVVTVVRSRDRFHERAPNEFTLNPELGNDEFRMLAERLEALGRLPDRVVHLWLLEKVPKPRPGSTLYHRHQEHGLYTMLNLAKALHNRASVRTVVHHVVYATWDGAPDAARSTALGACRTLPNELSSQLFKVVDLGPLKSKQVGAKFSQGIVLELLRGGNESEIRYHGTRREAPTWQTYDGPHSGVVRGTALLIGLTPHNVGAAKSLSAKGIAVALLTDGNDSYQLSGTLEALRNAGVIKAACSALPTSGVEVQAFLDQITHTLGPVRTLVVAPPALPQTSPAAWSEPEIDTHLAAQATWFETIGREFTALPIELVVLHATLDAGFGSPGCVIESSLSAFVRNCWLLPNARHVTCHWAPLQDSTPSTATSQVTFDRQCFAQHGLTEPEQAAAHERVWSSAPGTFAITPFALPDYHKRLVASALKDASDAARHPFVEATTPTERRLTELWMRALRLERVSIRDSFFDLGGHSLLAARLFANLHAEFDVTLPLSVLLETPTIEGLAKRIDELRSSTAGEPHGVSVVNSKAPSLLVRLNVGTRPDLPPFFVVGGALGNILNLRHLARICDPKRDFYGIQARGLSGEAEPHHTFVEAAEAYLSEVRRIQPHGPYYLGGFCIGGVAALEMARLLQAEGEEVALLAMLDSHLPEVRGRLSPRDRVQIQVERLREGGFSYVRKWALEKYAIGKNALNAQKAESALTDPSQYRSQLVHEAIWRARAVYEPQFYDGHVVLFRPPLAPRHYLTEGRIVDRDRGFLREDNGWRRVVGSLELHELNCPPGKHDAFVLEPYVRDLAERLAPFLSHEVTTREAKSYAPPKHGVNVRASA